MYFQVKHCKFLAIGGTVFYPLYKQTPESLTARSHRMHSEWKPEYSLLSVFPLQGEAAAARAPVDSPFQTQQAVSLMTWLLHLRPVKLLF